MKPNTLDTTRIFMPGTSQQAVYHDSPIEEFRNNPLIEALPPLLSSEEASKYLMRLPPYSPLDREKSREERLLLTRRITQVRVPLPRMLDLEQRISSAVYS